MRQPIADLTLDDIVEKVRDLATQYPDATYLSPHGPQQRCYYNRGMIAMGPPLAQGCIYGQILFPQAEWDRDKQSIRGVLMEHFYPHNHPGELSDEDEMTVSWLSHVQHAQDGGISWGQAVVEADKTYPLGPGEPCVHCGGSEGNYNTHRNCHMIDATP